MSSSLATKCLHSTKYLKYSEQNDPNDVLIISENLATEVESWQNQKRLRDLALPLSQKKNLRLQYEKCPKIKLTRLRAIKFAFRRMGHWCFSLRRTICQRLTGRYISHYSECYLEYYVQNTFLLFCLK